MKSYNIIVNPTPVELKRRAREILYDWDELKGTLVNDNLLVWFDDIHHVDLMRTLKIDYNERYDIVIYFSENKVILTKLYDRNYTEEDIEAVKRHRNLRTVIKEFEVGLENG
jgi:hypothetical protein